MEKKQIKNNKNLFDTLSKLTLEGHKIPLLDVAKHN